MTGQRELRRFLVVGLTTVAIDVGSYSLLLLAGLSIDPAKAVGFIVGTVFAYFANRMWTFQADGGKRVFVRFLLLYASTLLINVLANKAVIAMAMLLPPQILGLSAEFLGKTTGFCAATGLSAALNFIGMKLFVFQVRSSCLSSR